MLQKKNVIIAGFIFLVVALSAGFYFFKIYEPVKGTPDEKAQIYYSKGEDCYYSKKYDCAINAYKRSIHYKPAAKTYCELAVCYMEKNNFKKAIEYLNKSIELDSRIPKSEYALAVCYIRIKPPNIISARGHIEKARMLRYNVPEWFDRHLKKLEGEK